MRLPKPVRLPPLPWSTVAVVVVLGVLVLAGKDSAITWTLLALVLTYLGVETGVLMKRGRGG